MNSAMAPSHTVELSVATWSVLDTNRGVSILARETVEVRWTFLTLKNTEFEGKWNEPPTYNWKHFSMHQSYVFMGFTISRNRGNEVASPSSTENHKHLDNNFNGQFEPPPDYLHWTTLISAKHNSKSPPFSAFFRPRKSRSLSYDSFHVELRLSQARS